ncbi:hypothetical protein CIK95_05120, partial [Prevotella sp. P5-108]
LNEVFCPQVEEVIDQLQQYADEWRDVPMLAKTHGQPASPKTSSPPPPARHGVGQMEGWMSGLERAKTDAQRRRTGAYSGLWQCVRTQSAQGRSFPCAGSLFL